VQVPHGSGPAWDFDVIDLDTPGVGVIKISSSCDLSVFSSQVDPHRAEGGGDVAEGSSSPSIGELWPDIDKLDEVNRRATFVGDLPGSTLHEQSVSALVARVDERANPANRTLVDDAPGPSSAPPRGRGRGRGFTREKATQILAAAPGAISPHMQRLFVDRQYSPSTGMDRSE
jgi:hypothetical protein